MFDHYAVAYDVEDQDDRVFNNNAERGEEQDVGSLPPTTLLNTSH
jgi:hypothetical protein